MRKWLFWLFLVAVFQTVAQVAVEESDVISTRYLEDQFYVGFTYNFVRNIPDGLTQRNLSYGIQVGAIKDIPLNSRGTTALGLGLGLGLNTYYSNLTATQSNTTISYSLAENVTGFKRSKLETHLVEFPLEFRWRNSTLDDYRFWRLYAGVKAAYVIGARSKSVIEGVNSGFYNTDVNRFQYGLTLNVGYNTFNIHVYYALNNLFNDAVVLDNQSIGFSPLRVGVIFYIL